METTKSYELTQAEYEELQALRAERAMQEEKQRKEEDLRAYRELVDETIDEVVPQLMTTAKSLLEVKETVFDLFDEVIEMKEAVLGVTSEKQRTHTFTNSDSTKRIIVGYNTVDGYLDTVNEGIALVREYIESLGSDENSQTLVSMILELLSTDRQGNLKASRVVQLRKYANESGDARFQEGVELIEAAYSPQKTKQYIRLDVRDKNNQWRAVPLSLTDVDAVPVVSKRAGEKGGEQ